MQPSTTESEPTIHPSKIAELEILALSCIETSFPMDEPCTLLPISEQVQFVLSITPDWCLELEIEV